jgi:hypothetical protein
MRRVGVAGTKLVARIARRPDPVILIAQSGGDCTEEAGAEVSATPLLHALVRSSRIRSHASCTGRTSARRRRSARRCEGNDANASVIAEGGAVSYVFDVYAAKRIDIVAVPSDRLNGTLVEAM